MAGKYDMTRWWPKPGESPMEYWASFSPMAPFFGVPYRFADLHVEVQPAKRKAAKVSPIKADVQEAVVVPAPMAKPAPTPKAPVEAAAATAAKAAKIKAAEVKPKPAAPAKPKAVAPAAPKPKEAPKPAAAAPVAPNPAPKPAPKPMPKDDLTRIKGVGPKMAATLADRGITAFQQIAAWDEATVDKMDAELGGLPGRIRRDDWVGQAKAFAG